MRIEDCAETLRGHRFLHHVGGATKPATMRSRTLSTLAPHYGTQILARHADPHTTEH